MIRKRKAYLPGLPMSGPQIALPPLLGKRMIDGDGGTNDMILYQGNVGSSFTYNVELPREWRRYMIVAIGGGGGVDFAPESGGYLGGGGAYQWAEVQNLEPVSYICIVGGGGARGAGTAGGDSVVNETLFGSTTVTGLSVRANGGGKGDGINPAGSGGTVGPVPISSARSDVIDTNGGRGGAGGAAGGPYGAGRDIIGLVPGPASSGGGAGVSLIPNTNNYYGGGAFPIKFPARYQNTIIEEGNGPECFGSRCAVGGGALVRFGGGGFGSGGIESNPSGSDQNGLDGAPGCVAFIRLD